MTTPVNETTAATVARPAARAIQPREHRFAVLNAVALIDSHGTIVAVDNNWNILATNTEAPLHRATPGMNYFELCRREAKSSDMARAALRGIEGVLKGKASFTMDYTLRTLSGLRSFRLCASPFNYEDARVAITYTDLNDLQVTKARRLQQITRRLIHAQEKERKRISQEIHDDLGSRIALIAFSLREAMKGERKRIQSNVKALEKVFSDITELSSAMRNLSHHLYPPSLRYAGIVPALKTLATDFEKTPRFKVDLVLPQEPLTLPSAVQLCIFRIAQESLQNTVKHSGADKARVLLEATAERIRLMVSDSGRGFSTVDAARNCGLGLLSMEERAISIGGRLAVKSSPGHGTEICLTIPIQGNESFNDQVTVDLGNSQVTRHSAEF